MADERGWWRGVLVRVAAPVLEAAAAGRLHAVLPVADGDGAESRRPFAQLEALGRLLMGLAPWLESGDAEAARFAYLARAALDHATDPESPDYCNWTRGGQPLVDAAFVAQGLLRSPRALQAELSPALRGRLIDALRATRVIRPGFNNWLLFTAMVEAALFRLGAADWDRVRIDYAIRQHMQWYKGDGAYGDGPHFAFDYYNAFVIQPMLVDVLAAVDGQGWGEFREPVLRRARRYAAVQERMISPEGTFPPVGRSLAYRFGALQGLAQAALRDDLPEGVTRGQVRAAMTAVIRRMIEAPGTFDDRGFLRVGFCGAQPGIGEGYISIGSLYLCTGGLLPLGLPATHAFWTEPAQPWTAQRAWSGQAFPIDHSIRGD